MKNSKAIKIIGNNNSLKSYDFDKFKQIELFDNIHGKDMRIGFFSPNVAIYSNKECSLKCKETFS